MDQELRHAVLAITGNPAYVPVKPRVLAERLGLLGDAAEQVRKTVKKMVKNGELKFGPSHLVMRGDPASAALAAAENGSGSSGNTPPDESPENDSLPGARTPASEGTDHEDAVGIEGEAGETSADTETPKKLKKKSKEERPSKRDGRHVLGVFRRIASGDGFVRPEGTPASAGKDEDIYIRATSAGDAARGDLVRVRLDKHTGFKGKAEGSVVDIVERATNSFVGTYFERAGAALVQVDGKVFNTPIFVGDPGAKGVQNDDKVVIEMVRFPSHLRDGEGVITRVLGDRGQPGIDTLGIKIEFSLPGDFPEAALDDARDQAAQFDASIPEGRADLTGETVITIDPVDARDFDDAISLTEIENGHWLLGVHIADVSHFVQPKTALDTEAYDRATSVYLPDEVIPMLPEIISNNLASLQPDKVRYAFTCRIEFTPDGAPVGADVFKSAIKSCRRFTYEEVDAYLAETGLVPKPEAAGEPSVRATLNPEIDSLLGRMFKLAMILRRRRFERGALELNMPEMKVDLDSDGRVTGAHLEQQTESHQIIEEFMLAANEATARRLASAGLMFLRRVHGAPDPRRMRVLTDFVRDLGFDAERLENRFELQKLLDQVKGDPREHAVNFAALRSMQRAVYSPDEEGHYALASDCYCHFTSPIRRYPDLTVHRLLERLMTGRKVVQDAARLIHDGDHCSEREQRAASAERELKKVKLLSYLVDKIGMELDGVVTGVESFGLFVLGSALPAEGMVHISALTDDYYKFDRASHSISGFRSGNTYRLGDPVRVAVAAVDIDGRTLDFRMLGRGDGPRVPKPRRKAPLKRPEKGRQPGGARKGPKSKPRRPL